MYLVFGMIGILFFETVSRTLFNHPWIWSVELAEFVMAAYYTLGGAYTLLLDGHVRMDLAYGKWSPKNKALADSFTFVLIMLYLVMLLLGGFISLEYSMKYKQKSYSSWAPPVTPIKIVMLFGMVLMTLQVIAEFFKDLAKARGKEIQ
jgi:TRAP-type mannitol/chloroaromatic compound transport system permease small subunit